REGLSWAFHYERPMGCRPPVRRDTPPARGHRASAASADQTRSSPHLAIPHQRLEKTLDAQSERAENVPANDTRRLVFIGPCAAATEENSDGQSGDEGAHGAALQLRRHGSL